MPYRMIDVPPELVLEHKGVKVFKTYKDDDADRPNKYLFMIEKDDYFDVRDLHVPSAKALTTQQPPSISISAPLGTDLKAFMNTETYFQARLAWDTWFNETEPALIRQALIEEIDGFHIK